MKNGTIVLSILMPETSYGDMAYDALMIPFTSESAAMLQAKVDDFETNEANRVTYDLSLDDCVVPLHADYPAVLNENEMVADEEVTGTSAGIVEFTEESRYELRSVKNIRVTIREGRKGGLFANFEAGGDDFSLVSDNIRIKNILELC